MQDFDHVADDRMRAILSSDAPTREDIEYGLDHCANSLMLDANNPDVEYRTYDARAEAMGAAEDATSLADALQSLRRFWEV